MRLILSLMLLISTQAYAVEWNDLEIGETYNLSQSFSLPQVERSQSLIDLTAGEQFTVTDVVPLDMINVVLYELNYHNCPGPEMKTEMEIIPVQGTSPVVEIGALLEKECNLQIFIETRDILSNSFFQ